MADNYRRQGRLTGPRHGPSIRCDGRSGNCLFRVIYCILVTIILTIGFAFLIVFLTFGNSSLRFHVTEASLTRFELNNDDNHLSYSLALNVTVRNPSKRTGVYHDRIEVEAFYTDKRFAGLFLTPFYQGQKNTSALRPEFQGQNVVALGKDEMKKLDEDKRSGIYRIEVRLVMRNRKKAGALTSWGYRYIIGCYLKVPLSSSNGTSGYQFRTTKCDGRSELLT